MALIIADSIRNKEFKQGIISDSDFRGIYSGYSKHIFTPIRIDGIPKGYKIVKSYVTSKNGARRLVYLHMRNKDHSFFLMCRDKNDEIGKNISSANKKFQDTVKKYLNLLSKDILDKNYESYE